MVLYGQDQKIYRRTLHVNLVRHFYHQIILKYEFLKRYNESVPLSVKHMMHFHNTTDIPQEVVSSLLGNNNNNVKQTTKQKNHQKEKKKYQHNNNETSQNYQQHIITIG